MKILVLMDFIVMKWVFLIQILNNISVDNKFDEDDHDTFILIRLYTCQIKFEEPKALKKR